MNTGRLWGWTQVHEDILAEEWRALGRGLRSEDPAVRKATLEEVRVQDVMALSREAATLLFDPDPGVREAAFRALATLATPGPLPFLRQRLERTRDEAVALRLLELFAYFETPSPSTTQILEGILEKPRKTLRVRFSDEDWTKAQVLAARALKFLARRSSLGPLMRKLEHFDPGLRAAANEALSYLLNRPPQDAGLGPTELRSRWRAVWSKIREDDWNQVLRDGFREAGIDMCPVLYRQDCVSPLVEAVARGGYLSWNAQRLLRDIFAREVAPRIPHEKPERALPIWRAWLGSRLPVGALDEPDAVPPQPDDGY